MHPPDPSRPDESRPVPKDAALATLSLIFAVLYPACILGSCCSGCLLSLKGFRREVALWPQGSSLRGAEDFALEFTFIFVAIGGPLTFLFIALIYAGIGLAYLRWTISPHSYLNTISPARQRRSWFVALSGLFLFVASMVVFGLAHYRIYHPFNGMLPDVAPFRDDPFTARVVLAFTILGFLAFCAGGLLALFSIINLFVAMQRPPGWPR